MNWCFIGTGRLAETVARTILPSGRHGLATCWSRRAESRERFAKKWGCRAAATLEEAVSDPQVDAVYVVTPHESHFPHAKAVLELGKPVLCEKPFTVAAPETEELIRLAREKNVYLAEAMWTWFSPVAHQLKRWVDAGELDALQKAKLTYCFTGPRKGRLFDPARAGGALLDVGVYPLTTLYRLFGMPDAIQCKGKLKGGVDLSEEIALTFPNGLTAHVRVSIVSFRGLERLTLEGGKGSIRSLFPHTTDHITLRRKSGPGETFRGKAGYLCEFDAVAEDIAAGRKESALVPLQATADVMRIMDECRRQMGLRYPFEA